MSDTFLITTAKRKFSVKLENDQIVLSRPFIIYSSANRPILDRDGNPHMMEVVNEDGELVFDSAQVPIVEPLLEPVTKNRKTVAFLVYENNNLIISTTRCSSKDQFTRRGGRLTVLGRLKGALSNPNSRSNEYVCRTTIDDMDIALSHAISNKAKKIKICNNFTVPLEMANYIMEISKGFQIACRNYRLSRIPDSL